MADITTIDEIRSIFESLITPANVVVDSNEIPIEYENVPESSALNNVKKYKTGAWCRVSIRDNSSFAVNIGNNQLQRFFGFVIAQIFVPKNNGTKESRQIADKIMDLVKGKRYPKGISARGIDFSIIGEENNDGWFQSNLSIEFEYDRQFDVFSLN